MEGKNNGGEQAQPLSLHDRASIYIALADAHTKLNETKKAHAIIKQAQKIFEGTPEEVRVIIANHYLSSKRCMESVEMQYGHVCLVCHSTIESRVAAVNILFFGLNATCQLIWYHIHIFPMNNANKKSHRGLPFSKAKEFAKETLADEVTQLKNKYNQLKLKRWQLTKVLNKKFDHFRANKRSK